MVRKKISGREYFYLNENKRIEGKVKTKTIAYLGKTREEAERKMRKILGDMKKENTQNKKTGWEKTSKQKEISIEELANFCKAKGFIFRSSDIYGGFAGFWDFGPLGVEMMNNLKKEWWKYFVQEKENIVGMEGSIISHPKTWKASGHLASFSDVAVVCKKCKKSTKIDKSEVGKVKCDNCGGAYENLGEFNLMFKTHVGAINPTEAYLRGETAQGMFMNFKLIQATSRMQLPFGIAQIGKCFRNEIAPRDFLFRSREFHIGELEFFLNPEEKKCPLLEKKHLALKVMFLDAETQEKNSDKLNETTIEKMLNEKRLEEWHAYWLAEQILWLKSIGLLEIKIREHMKSELSHYSSATFDIDHQYVFGSKEIAGNANRGQYDLTQHEKESGEKMSFFDEKSKKKIIPKVIEPTFGIERIFLALISRAYSHDEKRENIVLRLPRKIAPIKAGIFPLVKKPEFENLAREIFSELKSEFNILYDSGGSIGRRYARNDEIGTPFCITIDGDSLKNKDVTIRNRDDTKQIRVKISDLKKILADLINGEEELF